MNLWNRLRDAAGFGPKLRNKAGGMAWINSKVDEGEGSAALVNRVVKTMRIAHGDFWAIDPPQVYTITSPSRNMISGLRLQPGMRVVSMSIRDECLTPIPGIGDDEQDESLRYLPPVPTSTKAPKGMPA